MTRRIGNACGLPFKPPCFKATSCGLPFKPPCFKATSSYTRHKLYGGVEIYLRSFLTLISAGDQW
jgi:hypothetical protein